MKLHVLDFEEIYINENRLRKNLSAEALLELAGSISQFGLLHPIVVRRDADDRLVLVAGERRLRALEYVWNFGQEVRCGEYIIPPNQVPCVYLGEIDPMEALEMEYEENARRLDFSWQEKAQAVARLAQIKGEIAESRGEAPPTAGQIAAEIGDVSEETVSSGGGGAATAVAQDIMLARNMGDPEVARAASKREALKILERKKQLERSAALGRRIGDELRAQHRLIRGDCLETLPGLPAASFDVILTDPPYGINAQDFGDSGGKTAGGHFYADSPEEFRTLLAAFAEQSWRLAKPLAHLYLFCDIEHFLWLRERFTSVGWKVFRTPFIWINPTAMRAPWPQSGPQRKWQMVLYANKGDRPVTSLRSDVLTFPSDPNLNHHAQKPVALFQDLLSRSVRPGDSILDPFAGTAPVFPAAHALKCRVTAIELDEAACGIAAKRLEELK